MKTSPAPSTAAKVGFPFPPDATKVCRPANVTLCACARTAIAPSSTSAHNPAARKRSRHCEPDEEERKLAKQVRVRTRADGIVIGEVSQIVDGDCYSESDNEQSRVFRISTLGKVE